MSQPLSGNPLIGRQEDRVPLFVGIGFVAIVGVFGLIFYNSLPSFSPCANNGEHFFSYIFAAASTVILLNLSSAYFYTYRLYRDQFFLFLSLGWLLNALYLMFEFFYPEQSSSFGFSVKVYLFSLLTMIPFYAAGFIPAGQPFNFRKFSRETALWVVWLAITFVLGLSLINGPFADFTSDKKFIIFGAGGILFFFWTLFRVGQNLRTRLSYEVHGAWEVIFPWTFYIYALIQPIYLSKLVPGWENLSAAAFFVAFFLKVVNTISVLSILTVTRRDYATVQEQLKRRSILEEIGIMASSIEHDIKTPLGTMSMEIARMRRKFQSNQDILLALDRIADEKKRISAITQIVAYLRGDRGFYERLMEKTSTLELAHRALKTVKREMKLEGSNFHFKLEGRDLFINCHKPMIEQALVNVLKNAVEAIREAKRKSGLIIIDLKSSGGSARREVRIDVTDNGCGIAAEDIPKVTTLYSTRSEAKPNSGIGLFIAKRVVRIHEGRIEIKSEVGKGTTVSLILPDWADGGLEAAALEQVKQQELNSQAI